MRSLARTAFLSPLYQTLHEPEQIESRHLQSEIYYTQPKVTHFDIKKALNALSLLFFHSFLSLFRVYFTNYSQSLFIDKTIIYLLLYLCKKISEYF